MTHSLSTAARWLATAVLCVAAMVPAGAMASPPIRVGATAGRCNVATIDQAIAEARTRWNNNEGPQVIHITRDTPGGAWSDINTVVQDMDISFLGGYENCETDTSDGYTFISGAGGVVASVFLIMGKAHVGLNRLYIANSDAFGAQAGGITFSGQGGVRVENSILSNNIGQDGGAIHVEAVGGVAELLLIANVSITNNRAERGGGIYLAGNDVSFYSGPNVLINDNQATHENGGGIAAIGRVALTMRGPGSAMLRNTADAKGGGIDVQGTGIVRLDGLMLQSGSADYGGGLHLYGGRQTFGPAAAGDDEESLLLTVGSDVTIAGNSARIDGGGLHLEGVAQLDMQGENTSVIYNQAAERGGGLAVVGPARAYVGAAGPWPGKAVFHYNGAKRGGAIAVIGNPYQRTVPGELYLYTAHPDYPMTLSENNASEGGGAVYGVGQADGSHATMCIQDTSIFMNRAVQGAAVFADTENVSGSEGQSAQLEINGHALCQFPPEARHCEGPLCNQVTFNFVGFPNGTRTSGAVFETGLPPECGGTPCEAVPRHVVGGMVMRNNSAGALVKGNLPVTMQNVAGYDNDLITAVADGNVDVLHGSFAGNTRSPYALSVRTGSIRSSLFLMTPGQKFQNPQAAVQLAVTHVTSNDLTGAPPDASNGVSSDPGFVDAQAPDFDLHLRLDAAAIDTAPAPAGVPLDLEHHARTVDVPARVDQYGPADRGAYEFQVAPLLRDGFESPPN